MSAVNLAEECAKAVAELRKTHSEVTKLMKLAVTGQKLPFKKIEFAAEFGLSLTDYDSWPKDMQMLYKLIH